MTKEIQKAVGKLFILRNCYAVCENVTHTVSEMDVAALSQSNMLHEIEVKISKSDFQADSTKRKWKYYNERIEKYCPNYFYYACPKGLIAPNEIPLYAGLFWYDNNEIVLMRNCKRLHKVPADEKLIKKMLRLHSERYFLGSAKLTYENKIAIENYNRRKELFGIEIND